MGSRLADQLRSEQLARVQSMSPADRVALASELGARALLEYMTANGLDRETAIRRIRRSRRIGRVTSRCFESLDADN